MIRNAFIITSIAGLSTLLGSLLIFIKKHNIIINKALGFTVGIMSSLALLELIPEGYKNLIIENTIIKTSIIFSITFILSIFITHIIETKIKIDENNKNKKLYRVGILSMIAIIIHNIPEGIITFLTSSINIKLGIKLAIAIALHNIPEGIAIALPIYVSTNKKTKPILYTLLSGLSEVVGGIIGYIFLYNIITPTILGIIYIIISGIMIYISIISILPIIVKEKNINNYLYIILGIIFMMITSKLI